MADEWIDVVPKSSKGRVWDGSGRLFHNSVP